MSTKIPSQSPRTGRRREHAWMNGYTVFAVAIMFVLGLWQVMAGLMAVVRDGLYATPPGYTYSFTVVGWGWLVLLLGALIVIIALNTTLIWALTTPGRGVP